ncbi:hypothetical protein, partial [Serratia marcescens]|uniref:hypothetical protein n=4 Tax=Serratia TaxID=613 RepID=UPI002AA0CDD3
PGTQLLRELYPYLPLPNLFLLKRSLLSRRAAAIRVSFFILRQSGKRSTDFFLLVAQLLNLNASC